MNSPMFVRAAFFCTAVLLVAAISTEPDELSLQECISLGYPEPLPASVPDTSVAIVKSESDWLFIVSASLNLMRDTETARAMRKHYHARDSVWFGRDKYHWSEIRVTRILDFMDHRFRRSGKQDLTIWVLEEDSLR